MHLLGVEKIRYIKKTEIEILFSSYVKNKLAETILEQQENFSKKKN